MSATTTANPLPYNLHATLADYELHHSSSPNNQVDTSVTAHPSPLLSSQPQIPHDWPSEHRRVPAYRPVNTQLDQGERRVYQNGVERAFIGTMFTGVLLQSTVSKVWRGSVGRVWNVGYKVGGEW